MKTPYVGYNPLGDSEFFRRVLEDVAFQVNVSSSNREADKILRDRLLFLGRGGIPGAYYLDMKNGQYIVREWKGERIDPSTCPTREIPSLDLAVAYSGVSKRGLENISPVPLPRLVSSFFPERLIERWRSCYSIADLNKIRRS